MEEIKAPKKERKFLKAVGNIAKVLANELVMGIARKFIGKAIDKVGNKRQGLSMALIIIASTFAIAQYPTTSNKQRLGFQTTGDGLVWRGALSDTASIQPINNQNAWVILDTINLKFYTFDFTSNVWNLVGGGGAAFTQPVDSLFFNVSVPTNNVDTAKMRWDSDLATVVLGLNDNVPNELGFKNFWLVKNQTGSTIAKGSLVYANGTVGASGRITVAKFIANGSIDAKYLLGITAHDLTDGEDGYVVSFGKIRQVNTDTFAAGAILYPSPTVAGVWTDVEPVAPNIDMPIGFCINSSVNNGTIAIRVASGYKLNELHDVAISSPVEKASLYYSGGLWRDTTEALLVSDTSAFARDNQISGTSGQVAYFNSNSSVVSDTALRWSAANKSLGINMTTVPSGASLIIKNSQEPVRTTVVANQTFGADTTNWTRGTGWTFNGTVAVATAATGDLTYNTAFLNTSNVYEVTYTISNYSAGILQVAVGTTVYNSPQFNGTYVYLFIINSASAGFRFNTSTFSGNLDNVSVVQIANPSPILFAGQDDGTATLYTPLRMPNSSTIAFGGGGAYTTGTSNVFLGLNAGSNNTTGSSNSFFGSSAGSNNTTGINNNFFGVNAGQFNQSGQNNNFFGNEAGKGNLSGINNNFFGFNAGLTNTSGFSNNFFGRLAGRSNTTGIYNNAFGEGAGQSLSSGYQNDFFGISSGQNTTTGFSNTMIGSNTGVRNITGYQNVFIGRNSGYQVRGNNNIAIGSALGSLNLSDILNGSNNIGIGVSTGNNLQGNASANVLIGNLLSAPTNNGSNQGVYQNVLFFTGASGTGTTIAAASKAGIKTNAPNRDLEVAGEVRITDLTTDAPTRLVGADADGDLGQVTLGAGLSLASSSLLADTNFLVTRFDTASMLTPYFRDADTTSLNLTSRFAAKLNISDTASMLTNYLRTGTAASTYLPLTGGTLSGTLGVTGAATFESILLPSNKSSGFSQLSIFQSGNKLTISGGTDGIQFNNNINSDALVKIFNNGNFKISNNQTDNGYKFEVDGTTGLQGTLTVNSSAVFNEAATDSDFRVESEANANMLFVDASTSRVGIGTNSPTKTLDVNGELNVLSAGTFGGRLNTNWLERTYSNSTSTSLIVSVNTTWLKLENNSTITLTLPNAATYPGKELHIKNAGTGAVNSLSSNIEPLNSTTIGTAILASGGGKWATLVSDGTYWVIMAGN